MEKFTENVIEILSNIPAGRITTYGAVARIAGNPRGARQVVRILNTQTKKYNLPWHRVVNAQGEIVIKDPIGADIQISKLRHEGVMIAGNKILNMQDILWQG
jgi:methylated-DNA-protein-cysteine methyltransferase related protein